MRSNAACCSKHVVSSHVRFPLHFSFQMVRNNAESLWRRAGPTHGGGENINLGLRRNLQMQHGNIAHRTSCNFTSSETTFASIDSFIVLSSSSRVACRHPRMVVFGQGTTPIVLRACVSGSTLRHISRGNAVGT